MLTPDNVRGVLKGITIVASSLGLVSQGVVIVNEIRLQFLWSNYKEEIQKITQLNQFVKQMLFEQELMKLVKKVKFIAAKNSQEVQQKIKGNVESIKEFNKGLQDKKPPSLGIWGWTKKAASLALQALPIILYTNPAANKLMDQIQDQVCQTISSYGNQNYKGQGGQCKIQAAQQKNLIHEEQWNGNKVNQNLNLQKMEPKQWDICEGMGALIDLGLVCLTVWNLKNKYQSTKLSIEKINQHKKYFQQGIFEQKVQTCFERLLQLAKLLKYFAESLKVWIQSLRQIFIVKYAMDVSGSDKYEKQAQQLLKQQFYISDQFISALDQFYVDLRSVSSQEQSRKCSKQQKRRAILRRFLVLYSNFFNQWKPGQFFKNYYSALSNWTSKYYKNEKNWIQMDKAFKQLTQDYQLLIKKHRIQHFNDFLPSQKQKMDIKILQKAQQIFKEKILQDPESQLKKKEKKIISAIITMYCDEFYATDKNGQSIHNFSINQLKQDFLAIQLKKKIISQLKSIPLLFDKKQAQNKAIQRMLSIAKAKANQDKEKYNDLIQSFQDEQKIISTKLYLRIAQYPTNQSYTEGSKMPQVGRYPFGLTGIERLQFKFRPLEGYYVEVNQLTGHVELESMY